MTRHFYGQTFLAELYNRLTRETNAHLFLPFHHGGLACLGEISKWSCYSRANLLSCICLQGLKPTLSCPSLIHKRFYDFLPNAVSQILGLLQAHCSLFMAVKLALWMESRTAWTSCLKESQSRLEMTKSSRYGKAHALWGLRMSPSFFGMRLVGPM